MRRTLSGLLADLGEGFARTHRSAAVALAHVVSLKPLEKGDASLVVRSGATVPCSRQYRVAVLARLR
jgi:two-component system LytT family response regulator